MGSLFLSLLGELRSAFRTHADLVVENLALRQQLANFQRTSARPRLRKSDRVFWVVLSHLWSRLSGRAGRRQTRHLLHRAQCDLCSVSKMDSFPVLEAAKLAGQRNSRASEEDLYEHRNIHPWVRSMRKQRMHRAAGEPGLVPRRFHV